MEITIKIDRNADADDAQQDRKHHIPADLRACTIHIVDDQDIICKLIKSHLNAQGYQNVTVSTDGLKGLNEIIENQPDLVILDYEMPKINGLVIINMIRADTNFDDMPIIVETSHDHLNIRNQILLAGASNIISKPIDFDVLLYRVRAHLEHRILVKNLKIYQNRVIQELNAARTMQLQLLPHEGDIKRIQVQYDVKLDWHYNPSSELGGDWWGVRPINNQKFALFVADFTGHGVGSAINTFRLHAIMSDIEPDPDSPARYLEKLNVVLTDRIPRGQFATMNYAIIDVKNDSLVYASAGHTSPMVGSNQKQKLTIGNPRGTPLGIKRNTTYTDCSLTMNRGAFLFLYTDALTETHGKQSSPLGDKGLQEMAKESLSLPAEETSLGWLLNKFYSRSILPTDDVTALWLTRNK